MISKESADDLWNDAVLEAIRGRRSIRRFRAERPEDEKLEAVVEAGRWAPSGSNRQSTRFLVIARPKTLDELRALVRDEFARMEPDEQTPASVRSAILRSARGGYDFCYGAPVLIVASNRRDSGNAMADSACALENMMLAAYALGLGSCWINQLRWLADVPAVVERMETLGVPREEAVCGALALGFAEGDPVPAPARRGNPVVWLR